MTPNTQSRTRSRRLTVGTALMGLSAITASLTDKNSDDGDSYWQLVAPLGADGSVLSDRSWEALPESTSSYAAATFEDPWDNNPALFDIDKLLAGESGGEDSPWVEVEPADLAVGDRIFDGDVCFEITAGGPSDSHGLGRVQDNSATVLRLTPKEHQ